MNFGPEKEGFLGASLFGMMDHEVFPQLVNPIARSGFSGRAEQFVFELWFGAGMCGTSGARNYVCIFPSPSGLGYVLPRLRRSGFVARGPTLYIFRDGFVYAGCRSGPRGGDLSYVDRDW